MTVHIYLDISHDNLGDRLENPALYFPFDFADKLEIHDIYEEAPPEHTDEELFIFGGGGLIHPDLLNAMGNLMKNIHGKTVLIAGHNFHEFDKVDQYPDVLKFFDIYGLRDYTETSQKIAPYCPALCCNHELFDKYYDYIPENVKDYVIYQHKDNIIGIGEDNHLKNMSLDDNLETILKYMCSGKVVITNSYHGYLFATYLKKPVIVIPYSTKFFVTRYPALFANDINDAIEKAKNYTNYSIYPSALATDRLYTQKFYDKIVNLANNELTIGYDIGSLNIGDNLVWFTEIINHAKQNSPKKVHIKSSLSKILREVDHKIEIDWTRPTFETLDRIYRLGVNMCPNWRKTSMNGIAQDILGIDSEEYHMDLSGLAMQKPILDKYITYASHGSWKWKSWQYPNGWEILKEMVLKEYGIEMIDCSYESNKIPKDLRSGALTYIHHSELFIGGPSGLTWLAYYLNKKQILISGPTWKGTEMDENNPNIKIIRTSEIDDKICTGCYHDVTPFPATHNCPLNKDFECWKAITPEMVFEMVKVQMESVKI